MDVELISYNKIQQQVLCAVNVNYHCSKLNIH